MTENKTIYIIPAENIQRLEDRANQLVSKGENDMEVGEGFGIMFVLEILNVFKSEELKWTM